MCPNCGSDEPKGTCGVCGFWIGPTYPGANRPKEPSELIDEREESSEHDFRAVFRFLETMEKHDGL